MKELNQWISTSHLWFCAVLYTGVVDVSSKATSEVMKKAYEEDKDFAKVELYIKPGKKP